MIIVFNLYLSQVNTVPTGVCDYLYGRDVDRTGKFCAGGSVDACQVIIIIVVTIVIMPNIISLHHNHQQQDDHRKWLGSNSLI